MNEEAIRDDAQGAEGEVRLAKNKKDGTKYAAKIRFNPGTNRRLRNNKESIINAYTRFIREVESMSHCNHKNIVKFIHALRDSEGDLYIIMEHCDVDLKHKIKNDIE